jgi:hypothetical protein
MKQWMICPKADECKLRSVHCYHRTPHNEIEPSCSLKTRMNENDFDCPACVPYKLKVGDRVRILGNPINPGRGVCFGDIGSVGNTLHDTISVHNSSWTNGAAHFHASDLEYLPPDEPGKEKKVISSPYVGNCIYPDSWVYHVHGGGDLNIYPGKMFDVPPPAKQYRWTGKSLTVWEVARDSRITPDELLNLCSWAKAFGKSPRDDLFLYNDEKLIAYATRSDCFRRFLLAGGYIEEIPDKLEGFFG